MDKYRAWISSLTPLNFANEKSLEQILYELIPILLEIKNIQDSDINTFKEFINATKLKVDEIKNNINNTNASFNNKRNNIRQNISNKELEITNNILAKFTEILNKINNFGNTYFEKHPDVFTKGVLDVVYQLTNSNTPYSKWNKTNKQIYETGIKLNAIVSTPPTETSGYSYCTSDAQLYYENHITKDGQINKLLKYNNTIIYKKAYGILKEKLFPETENGYFIGFSDNNHACYFASSVSGDVTSYSIKMIDLTTKTLTKYENLVMPDGFQNVYLSNNNHYIIKKFNEYYYLLYLKSDETAYIAKSNDLVHWANVGSITARGLITFRVCNNNLYLTTLHYGSYLYDEANNRFNEVKYNNKNVVIIGEIEENIVFLNFNNDIYGTTNKNLANASIFKHGHYNGSIINLEFSKNGKYFTILGSPYMLDYYLSPLYIKNHGYPIQKINYDNIIKFFNVDDKTLYSNYRMDGNINYLPTKLDTEFLGDIVINENGDIYDDKYLQKLEISTKWEYLGR